MTRYIHFTTKDRNKGVQTFFLATFVHTDTIVVKLLDTKHIAMIGDSHASHAITDSLVDQILYLRLSVKNRIISMYV